LISPDNRFQLFWQIAECSITAHSGSNPVNQDGLIFPANTFWLFQRIPAKKPGVAFWHGSGKKAKTNL
jgi:hypothetical protein